MADFRRNSLSPRRAWRGAPSPSLRAQFIFFMVSGVRPIDGATGAPHPSVGSVQTRSDVMGLVCLGEERVPGGGAASLRLGVLAREFVVSWSTDPNEASQRSGQLIRAMVHWQRRPPWSFGDSSAKCRTDRCGVVYIIVVLFP